MNRLRIIFDKLAQYPLVRNLFWIGVVMFAMAVMAYYVMRVGTRHGARRTVPDFSGIRLDEAERMAKEHDLCLHINDSLFVPTCEGGIVLEQLPKGGVEVKPGRTVYITINAFREKSVPVPYVAGRSLRQAKNMLEIAGLEIEQLIYRSDIATNYVLDQSYDGKPVNKQSKVEAPIGSGVTLYVGVEEDHSTTVVPLLAGYSMKAAKSRLWELGLNVGSIEFDEGINLLNQKDARLCTQSPLAEHTVRLGTKVNMRFTLDSKKVSEQKTIAEKEALKAAADRLAEEQERADSLAESNFQNAMNKVAEETTDGSKSTTTTADEGFFD